MKKAILLSTILIGFFSMASNGKDQLNANSNIKSITRVIKIEIGKVDFSKIPAEGKIWRPVKCCVTITAGGEPSTACDYGTSVEEACGKALEKAMKDDGL